LSEPSNTPISHTEGRLARRELLATVPNPDRRQDYLVELHASLSGVPHEGHLTLQLRYVPDRVVLTADGFANYTSVLEASGWESLEDLAAVVLDDVNNELVPRWLRLTLSSDGVGRCSLHRVTLEDRQPNWPKETPGSEPSPGLTRR
jgi:7-cyano-7-deazaguanine reductase